MFVCLCVLYEDGEGKVARDNDITYSLRDDFQNETKRWWTEDGETFKDTQMTQ